MIPKKIKVKILEYYPPIDISDSYGYGRDIPAIYNAITGWEEISHSEYTLLQEWVRKKNIGNNQSHYLLLKEPEVPVIIHNCIQDILDEHKKRERKLARERKEYEKKQAEKKRIRLDKQIAKLEKIKEERDNIQS